jgi:hypothetical protein
MRVRVPFLLSALSVLPAQASDLLCMPVKVCVPGGCGASVDATSALRLTQVESAAPMLHRNGESIPLNKTFEQRGTSTWKGINASGALETLTFHREFMQFNYNVRADSDQVVGGEVRYKSWGTCEVQR